MCMMDGPELPPLSASGVGWHDTRRTEPHRNRDQGDSARVRIFASSPQTELNIRMRLEEGGSSIKWPVVAHHGGRVGLRLVPTDKAGAGSGSDSWPY